MRQVALAAAVIGREPQRFSGRNRIALDPENEYIRTGDDQNAWIEISGCVAGDSDHLANLSSGRVQNPQQLPAWRSLGTFRSLRTG